jgi:hypothetical protein
MRSTVFAILTAALLTLPALADDTQTSPPATAPSVENDPNHVTCRSGQKPVGSMLPGPRVCHTKREWDDLREQSQRNLQMNQTRGLTTGVPQ